MSRFAIFDDVLQVCVTSIYGCAKRKAVIMAEIMLLDTSSIFDRSLRKRRYNVMLYPDTVQRMDRMASELSISRSELLEYCFNKCFVEYRNVTIGGGE